MDTVNLLETESCRVDAWRCPAIDPSCYREIRQRMALDEFKWDVQIGDDSALASFAFVLPREVWQELTVLTSALAQELAAAEQELSQRPALWRELGLPTRIRRALENPLSWTPGIARVIRFDFHPTTEGWRISEANSDVPGGYTEASRFTTLVQPHVADAEIAGNPAALLCETLARGCKEHRRLALLAAPGYIDDQQIVAYLSAQLRERGIEALIARPEQIHAVDGVAHLRSGTRDLPLDVLFRFYQGEWMTRLRSDDWSLFFRGCRTPVCNPGTAVLTESKRLPLLWDRLRTPMPTWRRLLPPTCAVSAAWLDPQGDWVLKAAYGNTGNSVFARAWSPARDYWGALAASMVRPREWVAQARFEITECATPFGPVRPCIGVYTIDGSVAGIYGRCTRSGWIDFAATDVAVFVEP